ESLDRDQHHELHEVLPALAGALHALDDLVLLGGPEIDEALVRGLDRETIEADETREEDLFEVVVFGPGELAIDVLDHVRFLRAWILIRRQDPPRGGLERAALIGEERVALGRRRTRARVGERGGGGGCGVLSRSRGRLARGGQLCGTEPRQEERRLLEKLS